MQFPKFYASEEANYW